MKLYFDGSHTSHATGYGFVIKRDDQVILEDYATLPPGGETWATTSNVAEYAGFIAGIKAASELLEPYEGLEILGDSRLVINQVDGKYKVRATHLIPFSDLAKHRVKKLREKGHKIALKWIKRDFNKHADKLASKATRTPSRSGPNSGSNQ
jgi:ribonuclease HI